jgi:imidazolonepropionase
MISRNQDEAGHAITLVRGARQLLTLRGAGGPRRGAALSELGIIPDGALLIRGGKILEAGPSRRVENLALARGAREINAAGRVVMPGFVDSQTQPEFPPALPSRALAARVRSLLAGMTRHGTTTVAAGANPKQDRPDAWKLLRVLAELDGHPVSIVPVCYAGSEAICTEVLPVIARRKLARFVSVNAETLGPAAARRLLEWARQLGFGVVVQAGASAAAVRLAVEIEAAFVSVDPTDGGPAGDLAGSGVIAMLPPAAANRSRPEQPPSARPLIEAGAAIALASGFGGEHCPAYNMQMAVSLACSQMGFSPAEAICAATVNGAYALALGHRCGSLEPGKAADLLLLNVADYREVPEQAGINHVHMVWKNGGVIYQEGEVTGWSSQ